MIRTTLLSLLVLVGCATTETTQADGTKKKESVWAQFVKNSTSKSSDKPAEPRPSTVRVALFRTTVSTALSKTIKQDKLWEMWRSEFSGDGSINLVSQRKVDKAQREEAKGRYNFFRIGDAVRVTSGVYHTMKTGYNPKTKKFAKVPFLVMSATIEWKVAKRKETVKVEGSFFKNAELLKDLATKVKAKLRG